jgi:SAM-dependent methyltransferase
MLIVIEFLIKRGLSSLLWIVWRARLNPFTFLRGTPDTPGRYYIDQFLQQYAHECKGHFLEFGSPVYRRMFAQSLIERYDIMDVVPRAEVTIVADLQDCSHVPDNTFDVIVCTQVLEHIANPFKAASELHRILKPNGHLLLTVPAAYPYHADPNDYWRFSRDSLQLLFGERFQQVQIQGHGNRLTVVATYWFWMSYHLPRRALTQSDPNNPVLLSVYARK